MNPTDRTKTYWRSLGELADSPEFRAFLDAEFPAKAAPGTVSRRRWLQLMGASLALAGVGGCYPRQEILPFANRPPERTPGKSERYATVMDLAGAGLGLLVTCVDGRPIKIEGNPNHPASLGATTAVAQAAVLELYDPDRSGSVCQQSGGQRIVSNWEEFSKFARAHFAALRRNKGTGLRVLAEASSSPTVAALREELLAAFPEAGWHEYEPLASDTGPYRPLLSLENAEVIVSLDADLFGTHPEAVRNARGFATGREITAGKMNRLYAIESCLTTTGAAADHRLAMQPSAIGLCVRQLSALLRERSGPGHANSRSPAPPLARSPALSGADGTRSVPATVEAIADDLLAHRGRSVVVAGASLPPDVHEVVCSVNLLLGNAGQTVRYVRQPDRLPGVGELVRDIDAGRVQTLLFVGGNPVYNAPSDLDFAAALARVETSIHLSLYRDETSRRCTWHVPRAHFLESWGDARAPDGAYSIQQPMIAPLCDGKSPIELLSLVLGNESTKPVDLVRREFGKVAGGPVAPGWSRVLHDGWLPGSRWPTVMPEAPPETDLVASLPTSVGEIELVFTPDPCVYDGRFANNGWLQEMPAPMTRLTWDNAALLSPATAAKLGVDDQTLVTLRFGSRELTMPAHVMPGQAPGTVAVQLGYGRRAAGHVGGDEDEGIPPVGFDTYALRTSGNPWFAPDLSVTPTGTRCPLASVQDHYPIDAVGREAQQQRAGVLIREATLEHYRERPDFAERAVHHPPLESLWTERDFAGHHRWGMTIDLSKCVGCGACVVACQAENNIPVVGKAQVLKGREMHWIRVDRYFEGDPEHPRAVCQPVTCQQCELAPCEQVCPVAATVHSLEGLNDMVYNRCVGTRYCSNNCPYKVRRFNYFNFHKEFADPANEVRKMVYNPQVTVRSRGVMEKCTYCVQRIQAAKIEAKNDRRPIRDGEIRTACQQVCPAGAIVFGDLADAESRVSRNAAADRAYALLAELNVKPRTRFLARIRNVNPAIGEGKGGAEKRENPEP
jgi:molybdopterin-containing oxidoreductase family iron-sulfur binding subunit